MKASAMNPEPMNADKRQLLEDIAQAIFAVSDHIPPSEVIEMDTMLAADLALESIEVASLYFRLNALYGESVSMADIVLEATGTGLMSDISVGRIVDFIANSLGQAASS
jgi:acyl carrier protein